MPGPKPKQRRVSARSGPPRIGIVVSRYNRSITDRLLEGALAEYGKRFGTADSVVVVEAPGAFELPGLAHELARTGAVDGVLSLGCLIKGETSHDRYIAEAVAHGLVNTTLLTAIPAAFGVLTVDTSEQAEARAGGDKGNKGTESMGALLDTVEQFRSIRSGRRAGGISGRPDKARAGRGRS